MFFPTQTIGCPISECIIKLAKQIKIRFDETKGNQMYITQTHQRKPLKPSVPLPDWASWNFLIFYGGKKKKKEHEQTSNDSLILRRVTKFGCKEPSIQIVALSGQMKNILQSGRAVPFFH